MDTFIRKIRETYPPYKDLDGETLNEVIFATKPSSGACGEFYYFVEKICWSKRSSSHQFTKSNKRDKWNHLPLASFGTIARLVYVRIWFV